MNVWDYTLATYTRQISATETAARPSYTSPGKPTFPSGGRAGRASPAATISAHGGRTARTLTAAPGSSGMLPSPSSRFTHSENDDDGRASKEEHSQKRHKIVKNGYNLGRDWFVERAVAGGHQKGHNVWWGAEVEWRTGLLEPGNKGA